EGTARDGKGGAIRIGDGPTLSRVPVGGVAEPFVVGQDIVTERQGAADVQDASAGANGFAAASQTIFNRQAGDGDRNRFLVLADIKDPAGVVAADGQETGTRPFDIQTLANGQFAAGQDNRLAVESGREDDRVAAAGSLDRGPQGAGAAVEVVGHGQGA